MTASRSRWRCICRKARGRFRWCWRRRRTATTTIRSPRARNSSGARPARSSSMSSAATSMRIWTSAAAANPAANFACSTAASRRIFTTSIEWLGHQTWSSGKVGGIGQSYFCMSQWWMAIQKPPSLACICAFDGLNDPYRASVYQGGMLGDFFGSLLVEPEPHHQSPSGQRRISARAALRSQSAHPGASDLRRLLARALRRRASR